MSNDLFYCVSVDAGGAGYDLSPDISSLTIDQREEEPDRLDVDLPDPHKVLSHALQPGMEIEVDLGTDDDHSLLFRGRIYKVEGTFPRDGVPTLTLQAYDRSMRMGLRRRNRPFTGIALSDIVRQIAHPYTFRDVAVDLLGDPSFFGNGIRQVDETDLAFLYRLASRYGCVAYAQSGATGDILHFIAQRDVMTSAPAVVLHYGRCDVPNRLLSFEPSSDVARIRLPRLLSGIDFTTGEATELRKSDHQAVGDHKDPYMDENLTELRTREPIKAAQLEGLVEAAEVVRAALLGELGDAEPAPIETFTSEEELSALAKNQFSTNYRGMSASGVALGNRELRACTSVGILDVGGGFSGTWYLSQVRHVLNSDGYQTEFECRR